MTSIRPFRFSLDPVLRQRLREEREKQKALAQIQRQQMIIENRLREIQQQITVSRNELRSTLVGAVNTDAIRAQAQMTLQLDMQARQHAIELAEVYKRLAAARDALLEAVKRRKSLELLREQRYATWKQETVRAETKELDDLMNARFSFAEESMT